MKILPQDVRYGLHMLLRQPGFTITAILIIALGIGSNVAIFSIVNAVLLRQLPFKEPERLVSLRSTGIEGEKSPFSIPDFLDYQQQSQALEAASAFSQYSVNLMTDGAAERVQGIKISGNAFQMLGATALIGRTLEVDDDLQGDNRVVVLSYGLWQRLFGGDQGIVGKALNLNGDSYTVVGVLSPDFIFPVINAEMMLPLAPGFDSRRELRQAAFLRVLARLKPGVTLEQASADLNNIARRLQEQYPVTNARASGVDVSPLQNDIIGDYQKALLVLFGAVGFVLLIACTNLANLLLARGATRHKEVAIRMALGATRPRLIRQFLTESLMLAILGGALALIAVRWTISFLISLSPANLPRAKEVSVDITVLLFALALSTLAGIFFGLIPALQVSNVNVNDELKGTNRTVYGGLRQNRIRNLLVISEIALSLLLLIGAGLLVKSFIQIQRVNPGFNADNVLVVRLALPRQKYAERETITNFYNRLTPEIENLPGVQSVGAISVLPLSGLISSVDFSITGRPALAANEVPVGNYRMISPGYFRTMSIPLIKGRDFNEHDKADSKPVIIINETLANRYWPNEDPVGASLKTELTNDELEVIGVVGNVKHKSLDDSPTADLYVPIPQIPKRAVIYLTNNMFLTVRTAGSPLGLSNSVRRNVQAIDKDVAASSATTMSDVLSVSVAPRRFNLLLLELFAGFSILLTALGLYSVISYGVIQRKNEIGIRMALGAQRNDVLKLILGQGLRLVLVGTALGVAGAFAMTHLISSLLFGVSATDLYIFIITPLLLICVGLLASYIPARKAMNIDPLTALRSD
jgi:putative ABC transport system permease protein